MSSNNEPPDNKDSKPKIVERKLRDTISTNEGNNDNFVAADSTTVTADGKNVVTGEGDMEAQNATAQGKGKVIKAKTAEFKIDGHPADVSLSNSDNKHKPSKNDSLKKEPSEKSGGVGVNSTIDSGGVGVNSTMDIKSSATLSDGVATPSAKKNVSPTLDDDTVSAKGDVSQALGTVTHSSLNDSSSKIDSLGFTPYVKALTKLICHKDTKVPLVIGVFGEWGAGKTSFMSQIQEQIIESEKKLKLKINEFNDLYESFTSTKNKKYKQVWFNAWKYDNQNDLWTALLQAITTQVEDDTSYSTIMFRRLARLTNWKFYFRVILIAIVLVTVFLLSGGTDLVPNFSENINVAKPNDITGIAVHSLSALFPTGIIVLFFHWFGILKPIFEMIRKVKNPLGIDVNELVHGKSLPDKIEGISSFEKDLEERLKDYLGKDGRLIIYIDDLDRCSPKHAVEIIEAVNLFLDTKRCVFVIGMDHKLISSSIELKYKELSERYKKIYNGNTKSVFHKDRSYGEFFLKKIIQVPITIPAMTSGEMNKYVASLLEKDEKHNIASPVEQTTSNAKKSISDVDVSLSDTMKNTVITLLPYLEANPRSIKRFYSMLSFIYFFYVSNKEEFNEVNDVAITIWFFLLFHYSDEIDALDFDVPVKWSYLISGCNGSCTRIQEFFVDYIGKEGNEDVGRYLESNVSTFNKITRILAI